MKKGKPIDMKIEKGVPIPKSFTARGIVASKMEVGDSIGFETLNSAMSFRTVLNRMYGKACLRKEEGGYRVWRVK